VHGSTGAEARGRGWRRSCVGGSNLDLHDPTSCMVDVTPSHANRVFLLSESFTWRDLGCIDTGYGYVDTVIRQL
jgi:hypothetical protein